MFTKLAEEVEFSDIKTFCQEWPEGVRVEYKTEIKAIPKTVSSFTNTLGGIFIIGVDTDNNNKAVFPIKGIPNDAGIEERIIQSALTGLYPGVTPEVIIRDVPGQDGNVVVIVRVEESLQAPHAIQNSNQVYIRSGSISQPYKLAEIGRIEYLLKRRESPQKIVQQILEQIEKRVSYSSRLQDPNLTVMIRPAFPYRQLMPPSEIYEYIRTQPRHPKNPLVFNDSAIEFGTREVTGGVCFMGQAFCLLYWELNERGIIYSRETVSRNQSNSGMSEDTNGLLLNDIVREIGEWVTVARNFYQKSEYLGNIEVTAKLRQIQGKSLVLAIKGHSEMASRVPAVGSECTGSVPCLASDLLNVEKCAHVTGQVVRQLLWGFNVTDDCLQKVKTMVEEWQH